MSKRPSLARRLAPAVLLASAAIAVVALFDPVFGRGSGGGNLLAGPLESDCASGTTLTSPVVDTLYGPVQIQATVASGVICDVTTLVEPSGDGRTNDISREVFPYLDEQAVKVGINFQAVSGATYTSEGYRSALQSILDQT